jgi:hypothetical protein
LDSNKTPEQPDNNTVAAKAHASHRLIPWFFKPLSSQSFWYLNHWMSLRMPHFKKLSIILHSLYVFDLFCQVNVRPDSFSGVILPDCCDAGAGKTAGSGAELKSKQKAIICHSEPSEESLF